MQSGGQSLTKTNFKKNQPIFQGLAYSQKKKAQNFGKNMSKPTILNSTKKCKNEQCNKTRYANLSLCFQHYRQMEKEKRLLSLQRKKERKEKQKERKANSPKRLKAELDRVFSIFIRRSSADKNGNIVCVCCGRTLPWNEAQNMHYISRANMNTRWDDQNCFAGCIGCNVFKNGNYPAFTKYLLNTYGESFLKGLISKGEKIRHWTPKELKDEIEKYQSLLKPKS